MTDTAAQAPESVQTERRFEVRYKAADLPAITGVRLSPLGIKAQLIDISTTGIKIECGTRIQPGSTVSVTFEGDTSLPTVSGRIARTTVAALNQSGALLYHVGIAFSAPIPLERPSSAQPAVVTALVTSDPAIEPIVQSRPVPRNRW